MARHRERLWNRDGIYWTWIYIPEVVGGRVTKRKQFVSTGQRDRALAREAARRIERNFVREQEAPEALELADLIARYLVSLEAVQRAPDTLAYYEKKAKHLLRIFGAGTDVHTIGPLNADAYLARRRTENASPATIAKELGMLRSVLAWGKRRRIYKGETDWCVPQELRGAYTPRERAIDLDEYRAILTALALERTVKLSTTKRKNGTDRKARTSVAMSREDYFIAFIGLGVRDGELYRITAADWVDGRLHVRGRKGRRDRADRWVTPPPEVCAILDRRSKSTPEGPLFPRWTNVRRDLSEACERAGCAPVTPNDLRRTFATWLAEAGVPELVTASLMGHANSAMIRRVYARIGSPAQAQAVSRLPGLALPPRLLPPRTEEVC